MKLVECVPNFSEGRDRALIDKITAEISATEDAKLLDVDPGADTNRTVVTFVGTPEAVEEAAFRAIAKAAELIDMSQHSGAHARMGATDVCPFVPVAGVTMDDCVEIAKRLGKRVGEELGIPVYLYENAAAKPERSNLATVRKGEYEGLADKFKDPKWAPDFGEPKFNRRSGATAIGAREFLIAYNVDLNTRDRRLAHDIALDIREAGRARRDEDGEIIRDENGKAIKVPGVFKEVKGVGWYIDEYACAQVSMNLTNYKTTPVHEVFDEICDQATKRGLRVTGSELVGLIPLEAMLMAGRHYLKKQGKTTGVPEKELVRIAIQSMGLEDITPFDPKKKIIEYQFADAGPLVSMRMNEFADELSTDSPAPGGGSASSVAGALAASLASMVATLTHGKKGYEDAWDDMEAVGVKAQELKDKLLGLMDDDTEAFNAAMGAMRMKRKTDEQKKAREAAIQEATKNATMIPMEILNTAVDVLELAKETGLKGNKNSVSDAGVAGALARAAAIGALYNVRINLPSITDVSFVRKMMDQGAELMEKAENLAEEVALAVEEALGEESS
jgi:glutamate formiminotransferase/formiminotetrahydrofolate cyclodeaminase